MHLSQDISVADAIRQIGVSDVTYYRWRQEFGGLKLAYFRDLPLKTGQNVSDKDITADKNGMTIRIGGVSHWIPNSPSVN